MRKKRPTKKIPPPPVAGTSWEDQAAYFDKYDAVALERAGYLKPLSRADIRLFAELKASAKAHLKKSKREQLNLSLRTDELMRLHKAAHRIHIQPTTLARAWLLERLDNEMPRALNQ